MMTPAQLQSQRRTVDAHHHLWTYSPDEFGWLDDSMHSLRRDFLATDLVAEMDTAYVDCAVAVQARQTEEETEFLLAIASSEPRIAGVVGWAPIASPNFPRTLERFREEKLLVGLRHIVQSEPQGFLASADFNRGIDQLQDARLIYDLLIYAPQLAEAIDFVDRHPNQTFVVDHCAKPAIRAGEIDSWQRAIEDLSRRGNVYCKVSGLATEADWDKWSLDTLRPYLDVVLDAFGPQRLMAGSDWPMVQLAGGYSAWWQALRTYAQALTLSEQLCIFGDTATQVYGLQERSAA